MSKNKLGLITIGQSPRIDITEDIANILNENIELVEIGALDNYSFEEICEQLKPINGEDFFVSRMRNGKQVELDKNKIHILLQDCINKLNDENCKVIIIMCTGKMPKFKSKSLVITPQELTHNIVRNLDIKNKIGLFAPEKGQKEMMINTWQKEKGFQTEIVFASPYDDIDKIKTEAEKLKRDDIDLIFMDCMGYSRKMKEAVQQITNKLVIAPRIMIAEIINGIM